LFKSSLITYGVQKGSVLEPLLFILYTNDLTQNVKISAKPFAHDTAINAAYKSMSQLQNVIES